MVHLFANYVFILRFQAHHGISYDISLDTRFYWMLELFQAGIVNDMMKVVVFLSLLILVFLSYISYVSRHIMSRSGKNASANSFLKQFDVQT